jgi:two-component sensor histidine kinase
MALPRRAVTPLVVFGVFTLIALAFASSNYASYALKHLPYSWWGTLTYAATEWYLWALLSIGIVWMTRRYPLTADDWTRHLPMHFGSWVLAHTVITAAFVVLEKTIGEPEMRAMPLGSLSLLYFTKKVGYNMLVYSAITGVAHARELYLRYRERERRALQLETQLTRAQLEALRNQIHPHFLFNTLNTISALLHQDVEGADRVVSRLGDLLRLSLQGADTQEVTLKKELEFLQHYLDIQHTRFHDRLSFSEEIAPETLEAMVPSLVLQPLVENAIRHGIEPRSGPGRIEIRASRRDGDLRLEVGDNGPGLQENPAQKPAGCNGIGLANIRARLTQLYGSRHELTLENQATGGLLVRLVIPFHTVGHG